MMKAASGLENGDGRIVSHRAVIEQRLRLYVNSQVLALMAVLPHILLPVYKCRPQARRHAGHHRLAH
jgi:hypothetical protein